MSRQIKTRLIMTSILAVCGVIILIRLGIWQLDRLEWRRSFNTHYLQQVSLPELDLNQEFDSPDLINSEYRAVSAAGEFDFGRQMFIQNQVYESVLGYHVLTPFLLTGTENAVMVDRGWIAMDDLERIGAIDEESEGMGQVRGVIRLSKKQNSFGADPDADKADDSRFWLLVNLDRIQPQIPYSLAPVYIQMTENAGAALPVPSQVDVEISEGPHQGYAIQWFLFAAILGAGYPFFARRMLTKRVQEHKYKREEIENDY